MARSSPSQIRHLSLGAVARYWGRVWRTACRDTWQRLRDIGPRRVLSGVGFFTGLSALYLHSGKAPVIDEVTLRLFLSVLPAMLGLGGLFTWYLIMAPAKIEYEQGEQLTRIATENQELRKQLNQRWSDPALSIEFDNEESRQSWSSYCLTTTILSKADPFEFAVVRRQFWFGVRNNRTDATLRNVRVAIRRVSMFPNLDFERYFLVRDRPTDHIDIQPLATVYFELGWIMREETRHGPSAIDFVDPKVVERLTDEAKRLEQIGIQIPMAGGNYNLPRHDGYIIKVAAFADDLLPVYGIFQMDLKDRPKVKFERVASLD